MDKVVFGINEPFGDFGMEKKIRNIIAGGDSRTNIIFTTYRPMSTAHSLYIIRFVCLCNEAFDCLLLLGCLLGALMLAVLSFVN